MLGAHLMFLQNPPHCLLPLQLLLSPQVEDQQSQQDEEEHHPTHCSRDGCTRPKQKNCSTQLLFLSHHFSVCAVEVAHPALLSRGQPLSSITVQLKQRSTECETIVIVCAKCACVLVFESCVHSRQCAVGLAGQTVSCSIAVLPHSLLVLLDTAGTMIHTKLTVLEVLTL